MISSTEVVFEMGGGVSELIIDGKTPTTYTASGIYRKADTPPSDYSFWENETLSPTPNATGKNNLNFPTTGTPDGYIWVVYSGEVDGAGLTIQNPTGSIAFYRQPLFEWDAPYTNQYVGEDVVPSFAFQVFKINESYDPTAQDYNSVNALAKTTIIDAGLVTRAKPGDASTKQCQFLIDFDGPNSLVANYSTPYGIALRCRILNANYLNNDPNVILTLTFPSNDLILV
jgi:hypothetical protein